MYKVFSLNVKKYFYCLLVTRMNVKDFRFDGDVYVRAIDDGRLRKQLIRIIHLMLDAKWRTLTQICNITADPQASISAQLRHLRKKRFGSHQINKRRVVGSSTVLWEYQLVWNAGTESTGNVREPGLETPKSLQDQRQERDDGRLLA